MARRNSDPGAVRIKSNADFYHLETLDDKVEAMVENRNEIVIHNIDYILQQKNISQAHMCSEDLEGTPQPPQMAVYKKVGKDIPFRTVARIAMAYGYTPEQLCSQLLDQTGGRGHAVDKLPPRPYEEYMKYIGTYHMACFATDTKPGDSKRTTARDLSFGLLSVYCGDAVDGIPTLRVVALTNCTEEERDKLLRCTANAEALGGGSVIRACYEKIAMARDAQTRKMPRMKYFYAGELTLSERIAEISLRQVRDSDVIRITMHNSAAGSCVESCYEGGKAIMNSAVRGQEHMLCTQALILSRLGFDHLAREELAQRLRMAPPEVDHRKSADAIISYVKTLFLSGDSAGGLASLDHEDRIDMLRYFIQRELSQAMKRDAQEFYQISAGADYETCEAVCR